MTPQGRCAGRQGRVPTALQRPEPASRLRRERRSVSRRHRSQARAPHSRRTRSVPDPLRRARRSPSTGPRPGDSRRALALIGLLVAIAFTGQASVLSVHGHVLDAGDVRPEVLDERRGDESPATSLQDEACLSCEMARRVHAEPIQSPSPALACSGDRPCAAPMALAVRAPNAVQHSSAAPRAPPAQQPIFV